MGLKWVFDFQLFHFFLVLRLRVMTSKLLTLQIGNWKPLIGGVFFLTSIACLGLTLAMRASSPSQCTIWQGPQWQNFQVSLPTNNSSAPPGRVPRLTDSFFSLICTFRPLWLGSPLLPMSLYLGVGIWGSLFGQVRVRLPRCLKRGQMG